ncbi:MAG TPA: S8 family serine peptidase [Jatrophihabitans sp.]|nr:S8 family serine peptidase [Jatrophihabitans sp.]
MRLARVSLVAVFAATTAVVPQAAAAAPTSCEQAPAPGKPLPKLAPRDPLISEMALDQAWPLSRGEGVTVGVVDSGVDPASPKLAGAVEPGVTYRVANNAAGFTVAPNGRVDCEGHGTQVAGVIAGRKGKGDDRVSGIAPAATIYPVAFLTPIEDSPPEMIGAAIRNAADNSEIVNLSFAMPVDRPEVRSAVDYALHRGVVVVASAANDNGTTLPGETPISYPAAYPGVIAVATAPPDGSVDPSAMRGSWISLAAPGTALMTEPRGGKDFVSVDGTSYATAIVSGAAALVKARFPDLSPAQVAARLEQTAVPPGDGSRDDTIGFGVVDPFAALTASTIHGAQPSATNQGSVPVQRVHAAARGDGSGKVLAVVAVLAALSVLVGLATASVRSGRRRGWYPGKPPAEHVDHRTAEPHPAELG